MSNDEDDAEDANRTPRRFRTLRPDPFRSVLPWVVAVVGVIQAVRGLIGLSRGGSAQQLFIGAGLAVLGVVVFFINRWQARRGH